MKTNLRSHDNDFYNFMRESLFPWDFPFVLLVWCRKQHNNRTVNCRQSTSTVDMPLQLSTCLFFAVDRIFPRVGVITVLSTGLLSDRLSDFI